MKQLLENLIKDWWTRPLPKIIPRDINLFEYTQWRLKKIISLVGFRRSGKTFALFDLAKKIGQPNCVYINFEDERIAKSKETLTALTETLEEIAGHRPFILLLDEIQNIPDWSLWARRVNETTSYRLFISGSSSKLSSTQLPTELRGRSLTVRIHPLNFSEFLRFKKVALSQLTDSQKLHFAREYLVFGGFPEIAQIEEGQRPLILDEYYQTFLTRDVVERHHLRDKLALNALIQLLLNSSYFTISKLTNNLRSLDFTIGKSTVGRYLEFLKESLFLDSLFLHTPSLKNRLKAERKPCFVDTYFLSRYSTAFSQNRGRLMENLVATYFKRTTDSDPTQEVFYWKDYQGREVDFVLRKNEEVEKLVQVSFVSRKADLPEREIQSLAKAAKQLKCKNLFLITWDWKEVIEAGNLKINCLSLWEFLLAPTLDKKEKER